MDQAARKDAKELAYLYDLYIVPGWREVFDRMVDREIELPMEGKFLDAGCGTGGFANDLALKRGKKVEVIGIDASLERLSLARGKAVVTKTENIVFQQGELTALEFTDDFFDFAIGDASLSDPSNIGPALAELKRVVKEGAMVVLKLTTNGSFDEFFSIYWEALYNLNLTNYTPELEGLITGRLTISSAEEAAANAGLTQIRSVTLKERFDYPDAASFFNSPLIEMEFLDDWLAILPDPETRERVMEEMSKIIDRERHSMDYDISIKATLIIGTNP
ncbi:MAG: class I SAM-dependent methyltransferase [Acidobacteria bacterium]|nr:class I SAM-dependent methyltransferase [Acidobacteriota bacterium]